MVHSTSQWIQWASVAGQHALFLYMAILIGLLITFSVGWWVWHRYVAHHHLTQAPPVGRISLRGGLGFAVIVASSWFFVELAEGLGMQRSMGLVDQALTDAIRFHVPITILQVFAAITRLGDTATLTVLCAVVGIALLLAGRRRFAFLWVLAVAGNGVLNSVLKQIFARVRPLHEDGLVLASGFSFPSGHSSGAVVAYGMLACLACQWAARRWHLPIVLAAVALAYSVGVSRVFLQVHFASDVMAGFASGTAWLVVCIVSLQLTSIVDSALSNFRICTLDSESQKMNDTLLWILSGTLMVVGLAGTVLPALPGTLFVLAGIILGAWIDDFTRIGWVSVVAVSVLAVIAWVLDYVAGLLGAKKAGASRYAIAGAAIGTVVGIFMGLIGVLFMPLVGAALGEYLARKNHQQAIKVGISTWLGIMAGLVAKVVIAFMMIGVFIAALLI